MTAATPPTDVPLLAIVWLFVIVLFLVGPGLIDFLWDRAKGPSSQPQAPLNPNPLLEANIVQLQEQLSAVLDVAMELRSELYHAKFYDRALTCRDHVLDSQRAASIAFRFDPILVEAKKLIGTL